MSVNFGGLADTTCHAGIGGDDGRLAGRETDFRLRAGSADGGHRVAAIGQGGCLAEIESHRAAAIVRHDSEAAGEGQADGGVGRFPSSPDWRRRIARVLAAHRALHLHSDDDAAAQQRGHVRDRAAGAAVVRLIDRGEGLVPCFADLPDHQRGGNAGAS